MKRTKKILAVLLAAIMVMSLGTSVLADDNDGATVTITTTTGGTVSATYGENTTEITSGETTVPSESTVSLTVSPTDGYVLYSLSVTYGDENAAVEVTEGSDSTYTFSMPNSAVMVNAVFTNYAIKIQNDDETTDNIGGASSGETYYAYKIFDVTYNADKTAYSYTISSSSSFYNAIKGISTSSEDKNADQIFTLTQSASDSTVYVVELNTSYSSDGKATDEQVTAAVIAAIKSALATDSSIEADGSATASEDETTVTIYVTDPGYYYVSTTTGSVVSLDTTAPTATVEDKNTAPTVDKTVYEASNSESGDGDSDAAIGDTVFFQTKISNINDATTLVLHDEMSAGLTFTSNTVTVTLHYYESSEWKSKDLTATSDYVLTTSDLSDNCDFEIDFANLISTSNTSNSLYTEGTQTITLDSNSYIIVKYSAEVNSNAVIYDSTLSTNSNTNATHVSYGTSSVSETSTTNTYVYSVNIFKYTGDEADANNALAGASFVIKNTSDKYATFTKNDTTGVYTLSGWVESIDNATVLTTTDSGLLQISGLDADTVYYIHETEAPDGYNSLSSDISFIIEGSDPGENETQGTVTYNNSGSSTPSDITTTIASVTISETPYSVIAIQNNTGSELPSTGGIGTTIFYVVGAILAVGAAVILITRRRMANRG